MSTLLAILTLGLSFSAPAGLAAQPPAGASLRPWPAQYKIKPDEPELAVWSRGQHSGNTFSFAGSAREAIGRIPGGPRRLQGIAEYTDGTRRRTEIPVILDAAFNDARPAPDSRGAITFAGPGLQGPELRLAKDGKSPMLFLSRTNCVGVEVRDNRLYGGNGQIASGPAQPLVIEANQAFPLEDPPRPAPPAPSIYEWQQNRAKACKP